MNDIDRITEQLKGILRPGWKIKSITKEQLLGLGTHVLVLTYGGKETWVYISYRNNMVQGLFGLADDMITYETYLAQEFVNEL